MYSHHCRQLKTKQAFNVNTFKCNWHVVLLCKSAIVTHVIFIPVHVIHTLLPHQIIWFAEKLNSNSFIRNVMHHYNGAKTVHCRWEYKHVYMTLLAKGFNYLSKRTSFYFCYLCMYGQQHLKLLQIMWHETLRSP